MDINELRAEHEALLMELEQLSEKHPDAAGEAASMVSAAMSSALEAAKSVAMPDYSDMQSSTVPAHEGAPDSTPLPGYLGPCATEACDWVDEVLALETLPTAFNNKPDAPRNLTVDHK